MHSGVRLGVRVPSPNHTGMTMWLAYGSRLIDLGQLTAGQLTGVVQLTRTIGNSLNGLMNLHKSLLAGVQVSV